MVELDTSLITSLGQLNDPARLISLRDLALKAKADEQEFRSANALRMIFQNANNFDPSGNPTPNALKQIYQTDWKVGEHMSDEMLTRRVKQAQEKAYESEATAREFDAAAEAAGSGYDAYQEARKSGRSEAEANAIGMSARNEAVRSAGGLISKEKADLIIGSPFEPTKAKYVAMTSKNWRAAQHEERQEQHQDVMDKATLARLGQGQERIQIQLQNQGTGGPGGLSQEDIDYFGATYNRTGKLPPMYRDAGSRRAIMKSAADQELHPERYQSSNAQDAASRQVEGVADLKSNQASLTNLTKMTDSAVSFEKTAAKNFDLALRLAPKAVPTNWGPFFNRWVEQGETMFGDQDIPPYVTAMLTGANEYAKIMSGSTGAQGSTVDSRREAAELFSPYLSKGQIKNVVDVAKRDMENRKASLTEQLDDIRGRLRGGGRTSAAPKRFKYDAQGNRIQ